MKKSFRKTTFLSALAIAVPAMGMAQDKVEASAGADLVSGYIWRGQDLGGVSIQPTLSVSYKGFSLSAWGTAGIEKEDTKEIDLTLATPQEVSVSPSQITGSMEDRGIFITAHTIPTIPSRHK